jgi:hypothetical protein
MSHTRYHVAPLSKSCLTQGRWFNRLDQALPWARWAADRWQTGLAVWEVRGPLLRLVQRVEPAAGPA